MNALPSEIHHKISGLMDARTVLRFSLVSKEIQRNTKVAVRKAEGFENIRRSLIQYGSKKVEPKFKKRLVYDMIETVFKYKDMWKKYGIFRKQVRSQILPLIIEADWMPLQRKEMYCRKFIQSKLVFQNHQKLPMNAKLGILMYPVHRIMQDIV